MALMLSLLVFLVMSVVLSIVGFRFWVQPKAALDRVMGEVEVAQRSQTHPSLSARAVLTKIGDMIPSNPADVSIVQKKLMVAGYRNPYALKVLYGAKAICAVTAVILTIGTLYGFKLQGDMAIFQILFAGVGGWAAPNFFVSRQASKRQKQIRRALPNAIDMLVICVESGLGLDQAIMQVSKELQGAHREIADEFAVLNLEIRAGKRRHEALHNLGERTDLDELKKFVGVLIQADRFGTSISQTLRNFSDFMRVTMRQEAEEKAAKIGVKLVFPIFFFILPSLFVVTVGPMVVRVMRDFLPQLMIAQ